MKKLVLSLVTLFLTFGILGCVTVGTTGEYVYVPEVMLTELPTEDVEITFWHIYGEGKTAVLDTLIAEFEAMFPNVTITGTSQSDYTTLRSKINVGISVGEVPTMALGYPDHYAGYVNAHAAVGLDPYINNTIEYTVDNPLSSINGQTITTSIDLTDFVPSYLAENNQYVGGYYFSVPFSKSTEVMAVNRTVLKQHITEIRALGITISDNGFLSHTVPLTYTQLEALTAILVDTDGTDVAAYKCQFLMNYDSSANLFINMSRQWNAPYTNTAGDILIDNDISRNMLKYINGLFGTNTLVLPTEWTQTYGSTNFIYGDVCMTVGSSAGYSYNIPTTEYKANLLKYGIFDVDFVQVPQMVLTDATDVAVTVESNEVTVSGDLSAVQQGPNIGILANATSAEKLYAWLFIKYLIETDNTAWWAMSTGYLPARLSAFTSDVPIEMTGTYSVTYSKFLQIAQDYWAADGVVDWVLTDERWDYLYSSMAANIAKNQNDFYEYDPAFSAGSNSAGSATAREEAGNCLDDIYNATFSPTDSLNNMKSLLTW
ncbi:MAG: extracellular solute-binding protein [Candidatus Izemoplasmatales bacterium]|jgi:multiple sugar transport system substrate-binding protein